jgi:CRP-like cAMP-binding protein
MAKLSGPNANKILHFMSMHSNKSFTNDLERCYLERDHALYTSTRKIDYIYFPTTSIIAILNLLEDGSSPEIATIGMDGVAGTDCFFGNFCETKKLITQSAGYAYRLKVNDALRYFETDKKFQAIILKYTNFLFIQAAQIAACNRFHHIDKQVCRFLLTSIDRWNKNRISLTHQRIANLLGVRRPSVSEASSKLSEQKIIHYHRGCVTVLDKSALSNKSCECYDVIKNEADKVYLVN